MHFAKRNRCGTSVFVAAVVGTALSCAVLPAAHAQPTFSIDFQGPTADPFALGFPDAFLGIPISEGDILSSPVGGPPIGVPAFAPPLAPPPGTVLPAGPAGLGVLPTPMGYVEVDALSYGNEPPLPDASIPGGPALTAGVFFSVDEFAVGDPPPPFAFPPSVFTEGAFGPAFEAAADVFHNSGMPPIVPDSPPPPFILNNTGAFDGDGLVSASGFVYPGFGLIEPNAPGPFLDDPGDNLDAVDVDTTPADLAGPIYISLDSAFADPMEVFPPFANTGTAIANGFVGGDVLVIAAPGAGLALFAAAGLLGLDAIDVDGDGLPDPDSDDLDALALWENGTGAFEPSMVPFDWLTGATDMLLFSVRRGSAVIGVPDSAFGVPIEEGDILTTPLGGVGPPAIFIPAEYLGLPTARSGVVVVGDDLDALDLVADCNLNMISDHIDLDSGTSLDCNSNGTLDECNIASGASADCNANAIPDECEPDCNENDVSDDCDVFPINFLDAGSSGTTWADGHMVAADFDADGDDDMAISGDVAGYVQIKLNSGGGAFDPTQLDLGTGPGTGANYQGIAAGNFNADGLIDVVVANTAGTVIVFLRAAPGSCGGPVCFAPGVSYATGAFAIDVALGDLDGDGDVDMAVANAAANNIVILTNSGTGVFAPTAASPIAVGDSPTCVVIAELNGAAPLDIAVSNRNSGTVSVMLNLGAATFAAAVAYAVEPNPRDFAAADFDGDGDQDLATISDVMGNLSVLSNVGTGAFSPATVVGLSSGNSWPTEMAVADYDGDGDVDVAWMVIGGTANLRILLNLGGGAFGGIRASQIPFAGNYLARANLNGDAFPDLVFDDSVAPGGVGNGIGILLGIPPTSLDADADGIPDECIDTDGDGILDTADNCPFDANGPLAGPNIQLDTDGDSLGDVCDDDDDGDGDLDAVDNCPLVPNPGQEDVIDGDGIGDVCDDSDVDTVVDAFDNCPFDFNSLQEDVIDGDGIGDICDPVDSDGDFTGDGLINGADIPGFVACYVAGSAAGPCAAADMDDDGDLDAVDVDLFSAAVLLGS